MLIVDTAESVRRIIAMNGLYGSDAYVADTVTEGRRRQSTKYSWCGDAVTFVYEPLPSERLRSYCNRESTRGEWVMGANLSMLEEGGSVTQPDFPIYPFDAIMLLRPDAKGKMTAAHIALFIGHYAHLPIPETVRAYLQGARASALPGEVQAQNWLASVFAYRDQYGTTLRELRRTQAFWTYDGNGPTTRANLSLRNESPYKAISLARLVGEDVLPAIDLIGGGRTPPPHAARRPTQEARDNSASGNVTVGLLPDPTGERSRCC